MHRPTTQPTAARIRPRSARARVAFGGALLLVLATFLAPSSALASHPEVSLAGSNFEIDTDANLRVDDPAPSIDWANVDEIRKADSPSGANDESFGQGSKEDTATPSVVDGSIPPNKSDLKFFGVYQEGATSTGFLNLFWSRVQDPTGTTNMDFEFNKRQCTPGLTPADPDCTSNGLTPIRTVDDLLIIYDLSQGGTNPTLSIRRWTGSAWGPATDLTAAGDATGSINTSPIPAAESDGLGAHSARTFGEAQLSMEGLLDPTQCDSFGSAYLKSRSSDSFTAALKDFVPPQAVNINNCGAIRVLKKDDVGANLAGAEFTLFTDNAPLDGAAPGPEDVATTQTCTTGADGTCTIDEVLFGQYWVVETVTPAGHDTAAPQNVVVSDTTTVTLTFIDPRQRGAISIVKTAKHADTSGATSPNLVAGFTVKNAVGDVVATVNTDSSGNACVGDLLFGTYSVTETSAPAGYAGDPDTESAVVNTKATCPGGTTVSFENTPLSDISVSFSSQVPGGTAAKISCTGLTADPPDGTPDAFDDASKAFKNLKPGTYTCTVVVDP